MTEFWTRNELVWGAADFAWPAVITVGVLSLLVIDGYRRRRGPSWFRVTAASLKIIAIGLVALCMVEPMARGTRARPRANVLPILIDTSRSMDVDTQATWQRDSTSRFRSFVHAVDPSQGWMNRLEQSFDLRRYRFDDRIENVESFKTVAADGHVSSMNAALRSLADRFDGRPVAGVLLMTDGNATDGSRIKPNDWTDMGFPVYPVVADPDAQLVDMWIENVGVRQTDFESAPTTVTVTIDSIGMTGQSATVRLQPLVHAETNASSGTNISSGTNATTDTDTSSMQTQTVTLMESSQQVRFRFRPSSSGVQFYVASVFTSVDRDAVDATPPSPSVFGEATLINNRRIVTIDRDAGPYRVLYVAGRPNWEFKFLRRALASDAEIQLVGLVRIADKEAKFSFRDRSVSGSNPLFAGLGSEEEEIASQYDEPVVLRFGVRESEELSNGFPDSDEELFGYHAVILDDIETDFFSQDQLLRLRRFVSVRGGGLLFLGGTESFAGKSFGDSPLGELSPVYAAGPMPDDVDRMEKVRQPTRGRISLTREGLLQAWVRLRENESAEQTRLSKMPSFLTINPVGDVKPGASELAVVEGIGGDTATALAVQRFGTGRTAAITIGDLWRWSMRANVDRNDDRNRDADAGPRSDSSANSSANSSAGDAARAWRQTMHWLVGEVPRRVRVRVQTDTDPTAPATIIVEARDDAYLPLENASVDLTVTSTNGETISITAQPDDSAAGTYTAPFWMPGPGGYLADATVTQADGDEVGADRTGWALQTDASEMANLRVNLALLNEIAAQTGGQVIELDDLAAFADELPTKNVPVTETWITPLWHRGWVMTIALACLCGEWGLRRWQGLA